MGSLATDISNGLAKKNYNQASASAPKQLDNHPSPPSQPTRSPGNVQDIVRNIRNKGR